MATWNVPRRGCGHLLDVGRRHFLPQAAQWLCWVRNTVCNRSAGRISRSSQETFWLKIQYALQFFEAVSKLNKEACGNRPIRRLSQYHPTTNNSYIHMKKCTDTLWNTRIETNINDKCTNSRTKWEISMRLCKFPVDFQNFKDEK